MMPAKFNRANQLLGTYALTQASDSASLAASASGTLGEGQVGQSRCRCAPSHHVLREDN
jgi:hypothetical protein